MRVAEIIGCRENVLSRIRKLAEKNSDGGRILAAILRQDPGGIRKDSPGDLLRATSAAAGL
jgi:hypothetical protein